MTRQSLPAGDPGDSRSSSRVGRRRDGGESELRDIDQEVSGTGRFELEGELDGQDRAIVRSSPLETGRRGTDDIRLDFESRDREGGDSASCPRMAPIEPAGLPGWTVGRWGQGVDERVRGRQAGSGASEGCTRRGWGGSKPASGPVGRLRSSTRRLTSLSREPRERNGKTTRPIESMAGERSPSRRTGLTPRVPGRLRSTRYAKVCLMILSASSLSSPDS